MVEVSSVGRMGESTKGSTLMIRNMGMGLFLGQMEGNISDNILWTKGMEMACSQNRMEHKL